MNVDLFDRHGEFIERVWTMSLDPMPEILCWGERYFVLTNGKYYEGLMGFAK